MRQKKMQNEMLVKQLLIVQMQALKSALVVLKTAQISPKFQLYQFLVIEKRMATIMTE